MSHFERRVDAPAEPFELCRALSGRPGVFMAFAEAEGVAYVGSDPIATSHRLDPEPDLGRRQGAGAGASPRWVGFVPYEACRRLESSVECRAEPLVTEPLWLRYGAVARVEPGANDVVVLGDDPQAVRELGARLLGPRARSTTRLRLRTPLEPDALHTARIERALEEIGRGNVYEVNLSRRFELGVEGTPWDLLEQLGRGGLPPHSFALRAGELEVCAASPELCLRFEPSGRLLTRPIKGTRPRHADPAEDARLARELDADPKERAELAMIIDVERNDLGRMAEVGSVKLLEPPRVVPLPSVHHRLATLEATLRSDVTRAELLAGFLPSGSVTGAPKRRAMELIAELEPHRRGLYTGAVGFIRQDGGVELAMAIRTLTTRAGVGHYFAGGGIVADSVPALEVEETVWKAERVLDLVRRSAAQAENFPD